MGRRRIISRSRPRDGAQTKLENPYALVYVDANDLDNPTDPSTAKLKSDMRIEPLILRRERRRLDQDHLDEPVPDGRETFNGGTKISDRFRPATRSSS